MSDIKIINRLDVVKEMKLKFTELDGYQYLDETKLNILKPGKIYLRYVSFYDLKLRWGGVYMHHYKNDDDDYTLMIKNNYGINKINLKRNLVYYKLNHNDNMRSILMNLKQKIDSDF